MDAKKKKLMMLKKRKMLAQKKETEAPQPKKNKKKKKAPEPKPASSSSEEQESEEAPALQAEDIARVDIKANPEYNAAFFSSKLFKDLGLCPQSQQALDEIMKYDRMTHIQAKTIPHLLKGRDVLGAAKTGSGKTLAFLIPAVETLQKINFTQSRGTGALIITPTRELAKQIFDVATDLCTFHKKTVGMLIGGVNRKQEAIKLKKGVNVLVATPGRLLDHLNSTSDFVVHNLMTLIIDEADQIMKVGFEEEMNQILKKLPTDRQTVLFSATQTKKVEDLARLSLKSPIYIGVDDDAEISTVSGLEQGYVVCASEMRFRLLFTFLKKNRQKKIMVFFSSCNSVKFHYDLLNYVDIEVMAIHGKQKQQKRLNTFYEFCNKDKGVLFCTDVAARGLDIQGVDWIVQFDPPDDVREYIHRVGRTCRGANQSGRALLFLLETELAYLKYLKQAKVELNEFEFPTQKLANVQNQFEKLVARNFFLHRCARDGYKSYLHAYASHSLKDCFDVNSLDLQKVAVSFGLKAPPRVNLSVKVSGRTARKNKVIALSGGKKQFMRATRERGDNRQFSR